MSNVEDFFGGLSRRTLKKNYIINGSFDVWQRGTIQTTVGWYGSDDRWRNDGVGTTKVHSRQEFTLGQIDVPGNPKYFSRTVVTSVVGAGNYYQKVHFIEGVDTLSGKTATLSFWAKADAAKNIAIDFMQKFGTGGSPSATIDGIGAQLIALTTSWKKYTATINIPSISGKTLGTNGDDSLIFIFWFDASTAGTMPARSSSLGQQSGTFDIAQVQLEEGSVATEFERRTYGEELELCQRYYQTTYPDGNPPGSMENNGAIRSTIQATCQYASITITLPVKMLALPVATVYDPLTGAAGYINVDNISHPAEMIVLGDSSMEIHLNNSTLTVNMYISAHYTLDAEI